MLILKLPPHAEGNSDLWTCGHYKPKDMCHISGVLSLFDLNELNSTRPLS